MFPHHKKLNFFLGFCAVTFIVASCDMLPMIKVWLNKIDFEVASDANSNAPFQCHIVVAYSQEVLDRLQGFDGKGYFNSVGSLKSKYRDSIEVFHYDIVPGKNKLDEKISIKNKTKAKGAFIFAKYNGAGKFAENVGGSQNLVVKFHRNKMEIVPNISLKGLEKKLEDKINDVGDSMLNAF